MPSSSLCLSPEGTLNISPEARQLLARYVQSIVWGDFETSHSDSCDYRDILGEELNKLGMPAEEIKREIRKEFQRKETLQISTSLPSNISRHPHNPESLTVPKTKT